MQSECRLQSTGSCVFVLSLVPSVSLVSFHLIFLSERFFLLFYIICPSFFFHFFSSLGLTVCCLSSSSIFFPSVFPSLSTFCPTEILCCTSVSSSGLSLYTLLSIRFLFIWLFLFVSSLRPPAVQRPVFKHLIPLKTQKKTECSINQSLSHSLSK